MDPSILGRIDSIKDLIIRLSYEASSAHLGSSLSCVSIVDAVLSCSNMTPGSAEAPGRDRVIVSKGHAAMAYYAALNVHGLLDESLLDEYLEDGSTLWGHVSKCPKVPAIDFSSGSLGHGLGLACGQAYAYRLMGVSSTVYCILSDGECNEGSVWEAIQFIAHHKLNNIVALVDFNHIQSLDRCELVLNPEPFADRWRSFGWSVEELEDGHDQEGICEIISQPRDLPLVVICRTVKGKGIPRIENTIESHYKPATQADYEKAVLKL